MVQDVTTRVGGKGGRDEGGGDRREKLEIGVKVGRGRGDIEVTAPDDGVAAGEEERGEGGEEVRVVGMAVGGDQGEFGAMPRVHSDSEGGRVGGGRGMNGGEGFEGRDADANGDALTTRAVGKEEPTEVGERIEEGERRLRGIGMDFLKEDEGNFETAGKTLKELEFG